MPIPLRHVPALSLVVAIVACLPGGQRIDPLGGSRQVEETPRPTQQGSTPKRGIMPKRVIGKQEPNLLLADDETSCAVSAERYRDTQIGKYAVCAWR